MTTPSRVTVPSDELILHALAEFQLTATRQQVQQIQRYIEILLAWNDKINLTAIRDPREILYRHICESMYGVVTKPVENGRLADVGSGAGFPGVPLKILRPDLQVFLVESNVKKATFIAEVVRELGLTDARVIVGRYEELGEEIAPLDVVCSRAFGEFSTLLGWAGSEAIQAKQVTLWVGARDFEEIQRVEGWTWQEPITVPQSLRRQLLVGTKTVPNVDVTT